MRIQRLLLFVLIFASEIVVSSVAWTAPIPCHTKIVQQAGATNRQPHTTRLHHHHQQHPAADQDSNKQSSLLLQNVLLPRQDCDVDRMSGTDLAYIGDVVYELFVRSRLVWPSKRTSDLQNQVVALVRAEYQSLLLARLKADFHFTDKEQQILARGRNASRGGNRRNPVAYQDSTAFEALIGYLYITDTERCAAVLQWIDQIIIMNNKDLSSS